jgi:hypothetical protein
MRMQTGNFLYLIYDWRATFAEGLVILILSHMNGIVPATLALRPFRMLDLHLKRLLVGEIRP